MNNKTAAEEADAGGKQHALSVGIILLAAGASTRMGKPKQLLTYGDRTLLRHAAEIIVASGCQPAVVVLGAHGVRLEHELVGLPVLPIHNADWERGIGSSIRLGSGESWRWLMMSARWSSQSVTSRC